MQLILISNFRQIIIFWQKKTDLNEEKLSTAKSMLKPFLCTVCDFSTKWYSALRKHVKEFHDREKPFKCEISLNYFGRRDTLNRHQRMVHEYKFIIKTVLEKVPSRHNINL